MNWRLVLSQLFFWAAAVSTGCAGVTNIPELVEKTRTETMTITWVRGIKANCGGANSPHGCAEIVNGNRCIITAPGNAPDDVLVHEFKHCFGYIHR